MILKQLKQLTLSATRRNADVLGRARFYSSPAVCQSLKTTKAYKRLSREDRRVLVESFVIKYRAANAGKFPSMRATVKEVGGGYYVVRDIVQEMKLNPNAPLPIVAKALSEVPASDASSHALNDTDGDPQSHCSASNVEHVSPVVSDPVSLSAVPASDASSHALNDADTDRQSHCSASNLEHVSPVVSDHVLQDVSPDTVESQTDQKQATIDSPHPDSDKINLQGNNNLVVTATHDKRETETATPPNNDVDSKCDSSTHLSESQTSKVAEECLKNSETEGEEKLVHSDSQEPKADHLEGTAVSANVLPTETSHVSEKEDGEVKTGENSSAWSNIISFAKDFANFWRKG